MDEILAQPIETPVPAPEQPLGKTTVRKFLNASTWVVLFAFLPVTVLIFLSQNTVPGDLFYPVKRGLEGVVLAAASVNPATQVAFRTDLTERRFDEAAKLLVRKSDAALLSDFIQEVQTAGEAVNNLSDEKDKEELTEKLIAKIDEYQTKLVQVEAQVASTQQQIAFKIPTATPTAPVIPTVSETNPASGVSPTSSPLVPTSGPGTPTIAPTGMPSPTQSKTQISSVTLTPTPSPASRPPTATKVPPAPTITPVPPSGDVGREIDDTQKKLKEIKERLEKERGKKKAAERQAEKEKKQSVGASSENSGESDTLTNHEE